ncbi:ABC transporter substrate-binding protein [Thermoactinomyces mirandus]|uniref:ABC transporter substrate-binding protein n=1 Tax=Thermoactinomyces mirandus TaxID=2756294 RepID=A0A7W1XT14_9BACL|nr:ABC transporter substrate-binding protein [Thermoactinomyces mirandus]MBA4602694.1 ABC transporter substrate-binding protein [Thermoactinomyces mirandus]
MKNKICWLPAFILVLCFALVTACKPTSGDNTKIRLVEVTHSLFYAPQYVAMSQGFFKQEGLLIELVNGNGGDKTMTTLLADESDIVLVGVESGIYVTARSGSNPVTAFAQLTQTDGSFLVSRKPIRQFNWQMLKEKSLLGQRRGGMPEMVSEYVQRKNKLVPHKDVRIIQNIDYQNLGNAFLSGTGDFAQLFEPLASKIEEEGKGYIVASFGKDSGYLPYTCYLTKKSWIQKNPEIAKKFVRAVYNGQRWVQTHSPEEIASVIQDYFPETNKSTLVRVVKRYKEQSSYASNPLIDKDEYQHLLDIMQQAGELPRHVLYEQLIDTKISQEVMQEAKGASS